MVRDAKAVVCIYNDNLATHYGVVFEQLFDRIVSFTAERKVSATFPPHCVPCFDWTELPHD